LARLPLCPATVTATATPPAAWAGVVTVIVELFVTTTLFAAVPPNVTVAAAAKFAPVIVTGVPPPVVPLFGDTFVTVGAGPVTAVNATICMTQGPALPNVAVALLLPAVDTTLSSAMSLSGDVMIRDVNPLPAAAFVVNTVFAPKISSFAFVVVADPLLGLALFPLAPAVTSTVLTPRYSRTRTSGNAAAWLNVTVTVFVPPTMLGA
jgi:hypothetical protein